MPGDLMLFSGYLHSLKPSTKKTDIFWGKMLKRLCELDPNHVPGTNGVVRLISIFDNGGFKDFWVENFYMFIPYTFGKTSDFCCWMVVSNYTLP